MINLMIQEFSSWPWILSRLKLVALKTKHALPSGITILLKP
jgi:hypothetical protein